MEQAIPITSAKVKVLGIAVEHDVALPMTVVQGSARSATAWGVQSGQIQARPERPDPGYSAALILSPTGRTEGVVIQPKPDPLSGLFEVAPAVDALGSVVLALVCVAAAAVLSRRFDRLPRAP